ncbi:pimeloyl-ACP methyl ester carboxylesterase [Rhizomicrobium palustre]|uniref:Pimeloyl-ACP methyl ester carboxylesterase n=1 Tax=Rhizomicrobium palustre TaxID=189966 RepID=A0A846N351_9PROT|nr:lipase family protein [Rhizomicrobium palustre]NIK89510.1 pimeloyl-ACP methyl ester carboxylesterase [Rhizomicrobium palustre]
MSQLSAAPVPAWSGDGGVPAFYTWTGAIPVKPGIFLRGEALSSEMSLPDAGIALRILYTSTGWPKAKPITVSGALFIPKGTPPKGGWPLIAWSHGTTGYADVCAPSARPRSERDAKYLNDWLKDGYAIVATDYAGLGTPGPHPYLQYKSEGMSVLDSIRAVQAKFPELSRDVLTMGQSQGSGAALGAALIAPDYAPELEIKGTVATGIVAATTAIGNAPQVKDAEIYTSPKDYSNTAYEVLFFLGTVRASNPDQIKPDDYISKRGWPMLENAQHSCFRDLAKDAQTMKISVADFYKRPIDNLEAIADKTRNFPNVHIKTPVFIGTGLADTSAKTSKQYNFVSAMCAAGTTVQWHYYPHATHSSALPRARVDSPTFVKTVMQGKRAENMCAKLVPPGPIQTPEE